MKKEMTVTRTPLSGSSQTFTVRLARKLHWRQHSSRTACADHRREEDSPSHRVGPRALPRPDVRSQRVDQVQSQWLLDRRVCRVGISRVVSVARRWYRGVGWSAL